MKRLALCSTVAVAALAISALSNTASASGYLVSWSRTAPAPATSAQTADRASSGYSLTWGNKAQTERASSGYLVSWTKAQSAE